MNSITFEQIKVMQNMSCGKELRVVNINKQKVSMCALFGNVRANPEAQLAD